MVEKGELIRQQLDIIFHFPHGKKESHLRTGVCETGVIILSSPLSLSLSLEERLDTPLFRVMLQTPYSTSCTSQVS
jgi:hypothetical protein